MRLPSSAHTSQPWRIHELVRDFELEDVWALPTPGGPDDFPRLVELWASFDPMRSSSVVVRTLFAVRLRVGGMLGLDDDAEGIGSRVTPVKDRLPEDLRAASTARTLDNLPFVPLYMLDNEWAAEIANRTVHGIVHLGWVPDGTGGYHGQLAIYVKRNGLLGRAYMTAIKPFRYLLVYPQILREVERSWRDATAEPARTLS